MRGYGPFFHKLNKGGWQDIISNKRLLGTPRSNNMANDRPEVRAYKGSLHEYLKTLENRPSVMAAARQHDYIEFHTMTPPLMNGHPVEACWTVPENGYLYLSSVRLLSGSGEETFNPS